MPKSEKKKGICITKGCMSRAAFNVPNESNPIYCNIHHLVGMVSVLYQKYNDLFNLNIKSFAYENGYVNAELFLAYIKYASQLKILAENVHNLSMETHRVDFADMSNKSVLHDIIDSFDTQLASLEGSLEILSKDHSTLSKQLEQFQVRIPLPNFESLTLNGISKRVARLGEMYENL